ncbi:MAG: hypothetical protein ACYC2O_00335 [Microthrixaceae bacterium]
MGTTLQVMVIENHPGVAAAAEVELRAAGHEVHRCHEPDGSGFPCLGVVGDRSCPLDHAIDVALLVRRGVSPRATLIEDGVTCALRAAVPVVEDGTDLFDPFGDLIADRVPPGEDRVAHCEAAARRATEPLEEQVRQALAPLLARHERRQDDIAVHLVHVGDALHVELAGPEELHRTLRGQLCVAASDAIRGLGRRRATVEVSYRSAAAH